MPAQQLCWWGTERRASLQEQNDRVGLELREQTALLEAKLASVQRVHTAVTDALLDES